MRIFNEDKTKELSEYDLSLGKLIDDVLVTHHEAVESVEEQSHYEVVREYENGGQDVEKVIDVVGVVGHDAYDEVENIKCFIPFTEEELKKKEYQVELDELQNWFTKYDIQTIQYARAVRLGLNFDRDIVELDSLAEEKAKRIKELKILLGEENPNEEPETFVEEEIGETDIIVNDESEVETEIKAVEEE